MFGCQYMRTAGFEKLADERCLLKLDGVRDPTLADPQDFSRPEYAYHLNAMAST